MYGWSLNFELSHGFHLQYMQVQYNNIVVAPKMEEHTYIVYKKMGKQTRVTVNSITVLFCEHCILLIHVHR